MSYNKKLKRIQTILLIAFLCLGAVLTEFGSNMIHKLIIALCLGIICGLLSVGLDKLFCKMVDADCNQESDNHDIESDNGDCK